MEGCLEMHHLILKLHRTCTCKHVRVRARNGAVGFPLVKVIDTRIIAAGAQSNTQYAAPQKQQNIRCNFPCHFRIQKTVINMENSEPNVSIAGKNYLFWLGYCRQRTIDWSL